MDLKNIYLERKLDNGKWKYVSRYNSTYDMRYHEDIKKLRDEGYKLKAYKKHHFGNLPIFEDK